MTFEDKYKRVTDDSSQDKILQVIRKNLKTHKFKTHNDFITFLKDQNLYITQPTLSRLLNDNKIEKNAIGIYEDMVDKMKSYQLCEMLNRSNANVYRPMVYSFYLNSTKDEKYESEHTPAMYFIFIKVDIGYENFLYEILSDYLGKNLFSYMVGNGCIHLFYKNIKTLDSIYKILKKIQKLDINYNL